MPAASFLAGTITLTRGFGVRRGTGAERLSARASDIVDAGRIADTAFTTPMLFREVPGRVWIGGAKRN
jgi:hypothetical protein